MKYIPKYYPHKNKNKKLHPSVPEWHDHTPFVYFLLKNGVVIYIGKSQSIRTRIHSHNCYQDYDYVRLIKCPKNSLSDYEKRWITRFSPYGNKMYNDKWGQIERVS